MSSEILFYNMSACNNEILLSLLEDPTKSIKDIAIENKCYRQKIWRVKKKLEEEHIIWGYTAVIDDEKLNQVCYLMLLKTKPMNKDMIDLMLQRLIKEEPRKQNIRLKNISYLNGEYDWIIRFSAPNHPTARRYYDSVRKVYDEYLLEKPVMVDVNFCLIAEGKTNPEIKNLHNFIPETKS
jgi:DNA-binding Lrp family transcriptional regulator